MGKIIGYARVANSDSDIAAQVAELQAAGCSQVFEDIGSSRLSGLEAGLAALSPGDTLVVSNLSRLSRSSSRRLGFIDKLMHQKIFLRSLRDEVDTALDPNPMTFRLDRLVDALYLGPSSRNS